MKITKNKLTVAIISIIILLASLTVMLCDIIIPLDFWTHPILNFLFCLLSGFGLLSFFIGVRNRSSWYFFISAIMLSIALFYALCQYIEWWIALVVVIVLCAVVGVLSFARGANKTEFALNDSPDYKNYEQRKAEKVAQEKDKEEDPLPEIKSFK